jgi:hypothetical protein
MTDAFGLTVEASKIQQARFDDGPERRTPGGLHPLPTAH